MDRKCTVPYPGVDKVKVKVNDEVKVNLRRRLSEATPSANIAKRKRRQDKASPSRAKIGRRQGNVTRARQPQCCSPIPMGRKDHGGGDVVGKPQSPDNQGMVVKRRER